MGTAYKIDFTDQNLNRRFELAPFTTNGPATPNDDTLSAKSTDAATTLLLYGKGAPDYGERIQENMIHILENFSNAVEPVYPTHGQIWNDTSMSPSQLRVFNAYKYEIVLAEPPFHTQLNYLAFTPDTANDSAAQLARLVINKKISLYQSGTSDREKYSITTAAYVNTASNIEFVVSPTPTTSRTGWFVGGWEYALQENTPLHNHWEINPSTSLPGTAGPGLWTLKNVPDPDGSYDVTNKRYVDNEITAAINANNSIAELEDTDVVGPANNEILLFNGTSGKWENRPIIDAIIPATGGTMSGDIDMDNAYSVINLRNPIDPGDAVNLQYLDSVVLTLTSSAVSVLDDLTDVLAPAPLTGHMLEWSGGLWRNITAATFISNNNIITTDGGVFTGLLYIPTTTPPANNSVTHKKYVDDEIAAALAASGDGVVNALSFDNTSKILTITTTLGSTFNANLAGAAGTTSDLTHEIITPNDTGSYPTEPIGVALENAFYDYPLYPQVVLDQIIREYSIILGRMATPKPRFVVSVDNGTGTVVNMNASDLGATQIHAPLTGGGSGPYVVGQNRLSVYINGIKQYADEFGFTDLPATDGAPGFNNIGLWHGMETGLAIGTNYDIDIDVDGSGATTYTILGDDAQRMGNLVDALNVAAGGAFSVMLFDGTLHFYSNTSGSGSSMDVTNGSGANADLIAAVVGNAGTTGTIELDLAGKEFNVTPATDFSYKELGLVGFESQEFEFNSTQSLGAVIEVVIEVDLFNRE